ncbi:hypothetical protein Bca52824_047932 [Brassica carinata]|uniref:Transmembrane protein n=1 Tax=Brassica carinata TaxID=52824 RepID=A0A8X7RI18_BRACI|nr:hypothetical protein Bca52824_047932 [Brassica carinata]
MEMEGNARLSGETMKDKGVNVENKPIWGPRIWFLLTPCCSGVSTRCWETWKWLESALRVGFAYRVVDLFIRAVLSGFEGAWGVVSTLLAQIWYGRALVRCGCRWLPFLCLDVSAREWSSSALKGVLWTLFLKSARWLSDLLFVLCLPLPLVFLVVVIKFYIGAWSPSISGSSRLFR